MDGLSMLEVSRQWQCRGPSISSVTGVETDILEIFAITLLCAFPWEKSVMRGV